MQLPDEIIDLIFQYVDLSIIRDLNIPLSREVKLLSRYHHKYNYDESSQKLYEQKSNLTLYNISDWLYVGNDLYYISKGRLWKNIAPTKYTGIYHIVSYLPKLTLLEEDGHLLFLETNDRSEDTFYKVIHKRGFIIGITRQRHLVIYKGTKCVFRSEAYLPMPQILIPDNIIKVGSIVITLTDHNFHVSL